MCIIIIKINKKEMKYLECKGVSFTENGISHTDSRHRRTYYLTESVKNMKLHKEYLEAITVGTVK
ncbi:hypothetical protein DW954_02080 [Clostridium sp. AM45-5]|nr:hypothetical protein DW954_02080 [Clostridium sp. AM45-5]